MSAPDSEATVLIVPGLRDHVERHWQTLLAAELPRVRCVAPMGRQDLDLAARFDAIEREARAIEGPIVIVAHSAGTLMVAHWAARTSREVRGALLAVPPDFERPMPAGYPTVEQLRVAGWLPVPRKRLPFPCIVAGSQDDPLATYARVAELASDWGATALVNLGHVGHLNPDSGFGPWPGARHWIRQLATVAC